MVLPRVLKHAITSALYVSVLSAVTAVGTLGTAPAWASPRGTETPIEDGRFVLHNHPAASRAEPGYGLRLDELFNVTSGPDVFTFDFEAPGALVHLDLLGDSIRIHGTALGGRDIGAEHDPAWTSLVDIDFVYTGVRAFSTDNDLVAMQGEAVGAGSLTWLDTGEVIPLGAKASGDGTMFRFGDSADDDGYLGHNGLNGWGWLMHGDPAQVPGVSDWLFTAERDDTIIGEVPLSVNQTTGEVGFEFELAVLNPDAGASYHWAFGDESEFDGPSVSKSFDKGGLYTVELMCFDSSGSLTGQNFLLLSVFDGIGTDFFGLPFPALQGDVDGDGALTLSDALTLRQGLSGLMPIVDPQVRERADFDLDGDLTPLDAELLEFALLAPEGYPSQIFPSAAMPGGTVRLYSPALLDPGANVTLQVGSAPSFSAERIALGQTTFFVPLDVLSPGEFTTSGGMTTVRVYDSGSLVEEFPFVVLDPPAIDTADPLGDTVAFFEETQTLRARFPQLMAEWRQTMLFVELGYTQQQADLMLVGLEAIFTELNELESNLIAQLALLDPIQQETLAQMMAAAGVTEQLDLLIELNSELDDSTRGGPPITRTEIEVLCRLAAASEALSDAAFWSNIACYTLVGVGTVCIFIPFDGPVCDVAALLAAAATCTTYAGYVEAAALILSLTPRLGNSLSVTTEPIDGTDPMQTRIRATVPLSVGVCGVSVGNALSLLATRITHRVLRTGPLAPFYLQLRLYGPAIADQIEMTVSSAIGDFISQENLGGLLQDVANSVCQLINIGSANAVVAVTSANTVLSPNVGSLQAMSDGSAIYTCPDPMSSPVEQVNIRVDFDNCLQLLSASATINCEALRTITVTIGDNGSLNDDIFAASVNGRTVVAMSAPTRSISGSVDLPPGTHSLVMRGLAAPDDIGTYFVSVSGGGATLSGPGGCGSSCTTASGSNLSAGTSLSWTLTVPGGNN